MDRLESLLNEVRLLWHVLVQTGEELLAGLPVTLAMRAVLEELERDGAAPVPRIARARRVSRQHIQIIVNDLLKAHLVRLRENAAHKRSSLVELTPQGRELLATIHAREAAFLGALPFKLGHGELKQARKALRSIRNTLERSEP